MTESREFRKLVSVIFLLFFLHSTQASFAGPIQGGSSGSPMTYEAITGESADEDRSVWDRFYNHKFNAYGKDAVGFLREHLKEIPKGRAFVPAMGEGRNAIFLAKNGFKVDGVDLSDVAVDHAITEARKNKVLIKGLVADLNTYKYENNTYDFVFVSLFYMADLVPKFKKVVKRGGYIMFYCKLDTGKPSQSGSPDDFLVKPGELKAALRDFEIRAYKEYRDEQGEVVAILARKP